jgi:N,N'-diacetyllegionaminate synthase
MTSTFIIAEAGVNHNGSLALAKRLVDAAHDAQADAIKFQTFRAERLATREAKKVEYQERNLGVGGSQYDMLKELELSTCEFSELNAYCKKRGMLFLSTPFDKESARFLVEDLGMNLMKVPSGEVTNHGFLAYLASFGAPMIVSTGMCTLEEVGGAVHVIKKSGHSNALTLLQCTTRYPCPPQDANLNAMLMLKETFGFPVGFSDHTMGIEVAFAAVAMGATILEKHFTLDPSMVGPDHRCSLDPSQLRELVSGVRNIEKALGSPEKVPSREEQIIKRLVRQSVVAGCDLKAGVLLSKDHITLKRSNGKISPQEIPLLLNRRLVRDMNIDEPFGWSDVESNS